jgi:hypothetical protein
MLRLFLCLTGLFVLSSSFAASTHPRDSLRDPYFGEALYYAHQGRYFDAIARLDTELGQHSIPCITT